MMNSEKKDAIYIAVGIFIIIFLGVLIVDRIYKYNCDHASITDAWKDPKCREYFKKRMND